MFFPISKTVFEYCIIFSYVVVKLKRNCDSLKICVKKLKDLRS